MRHLRSGTIQAFLLLEAAKFSLGIPASTALAPINPQSQITTIEAQPRGMSDDHDLVAEPKSKPWLGYYDFLITEGSYKFWITFELFTVALLIYAAFAALYYAKYTSADIDYDDSDYFFRKRRSIQEKTTFLGLTPDTYLRIFEAISDLNHKYS